MKKLISTLSMALMLCSTISNAQTAADFTALDCNGVSHNLYTDLSAGKVIVVTWVMPCGSCISGAASAYNAVQSFATSNPGKVFNYLVDDDGNTSCSSLASWAMANGINTSNISVFGNSPVTINEANYGGSGMPHVIVIGPDKTIYLNLLNNFANNQAAITAAIAAALAPVGLDEKTKTTVAIYPNPATTLLQIKSATDIDYITIKNIEGNTVSSMHGAAIKQVSVANLTAGNYAIQLFSKDKLVSQGTFAKQ
jgi:hypothetical protein